jgi:ribose 5-phosphate isomerase A
MELAVEDRAKRDVGYRAVDEYVRDGTCIGLGTGTTAYYAIERVGQLVASGWKLRAIPTSAETARLCGERNIELAQLGDAAIDVAIDGADEAAPDRSLIKGGGGALFREKAVALAARAFVAIVTDRKVVAQLGAFPLPVEIVPFSLRFVTQQIAALGIPVAVRQRDGNPFVTDNGNAILDCHFGTIEHPGELDRTLRDMHGVVATGLFVGVTVRVLVANVDGTMSAF